MARVSKQNSSGHFTRGHLRHLDYLVRNLGTPDGMRALGEFIRNVAASSLLLWFVFSDPHPFPEHVFRATLALALSKAIARP
jgi:hypothetical protein